MKRNCRVGHHTEVLEHQETRENDESNVLFNNDAKRYDDLRVSRSIQHSNSDATTSS